MVMVKLCKLAVKVNFPICIKLITQMQLYSSPPLKICSTCVPFYTSLWGGHGICNFKRSVK